MRSSSSSRLPLVAPASSSIRSASAAGSKALVSAGRGASPRPAGDRRSVRPAEARIRTGSPHRGPPRLRASGSGGAADRSRPAGRGAKVIALVPPPGDGEVEVAAQAAVGRDDEPVLVQHMLGGALALHTRRTATVSSAIEGSPGAPRRDRAGSPRRALPGRSIGYFGEPGALEQRAWWSMAGKSCSNRVTLSEGPRNRYPPGRHRVVEQRHHRLLQPFIEIDQRLRQERRSTRENGGSFTRLWLENRIRSRISGVMVKRSACGIT